MLELCTFTGKQCIEPGKSPAGMLPFCAKLHVCLCVATLLWLCPIRKQIITRHARYATAGVEVSHTPDGSPLVDPIWRGEWQFACICGTLDQDGSLAKDKVGSEG